MRFTSVSAKYADISKVTCVSNTFTDTLYHQY